MFANTKEGVKADMKNAERKARDQVEGEEGHVAELAQRAGRTARRYYDAAANELHDDYDMVTSRIRSNPVQASAIALGLGVIIGALFRR